MSGAGRLTPPNATRCSGRSLMPLLVHQGRRSCVQKAAASCRTNDPFVASKSAAVAAALTGRRWIQLVAPSSRS